MTAPRMIRTVPTTQPVIESTYGRDSIPDPTATATKANMLPLTLPYSRGPNVLCQNVLLFIPSAISVLGPFRFELI